MAGVKKRLNHRDTEKRIQNHENTKDENTKGIMSQRTSGTVPGKSFTVLHFFVAFVFRVCVILYSLLCVSVPVWFNLFLPYPLHRAKLVNHRRSGPASGPRRCRSVP